MRSFLYTKSMKHLENIGLRAITLNTVVQFIIRIITSTSTLIATLLIASVSGFELVGSFTKVISFVSIFYLLVDFGMNPMFLKKHFSTAEENLGNLLATRLFLAVLFIPIIALLAYLLPEGVFSGYSQLEKYGIILFSFTLIPFALQTSLQAILQKKLSYKLQLLPSFISSAILILLIYIATKHDNFALLLFSYFLTNTLQVILLYLIMKKKLSLSPQFRNAKLFSKALIISSLPLGIMLFFNLLYSRADTFILALFRPTQEIGIYGVSYRFFELAIAIPAFLSNSAYPLLLEKMHKEELYYKLFKKYIILFTALALLASLFVFTFSPLIAFIKDEFKLSVLPLQILALSLPFFFLTSILQWHFLIKEKLKFLVPLYGSALLLNILLNLIFVPQFSYLAAAVTTGLSEGLVLIVMVWYFFRIRN